MNNEKNKASVESLADEIRREYFKNWRAANKDKVKASNRRYWEKKALEKMEAKK